MVIRVIQLSLFEESTVPIAMPAPIVASYPTFQQVEQTCTELMMQGNQPELVRYLTQLCDQGFCEWVQKFCRLRADFGLKVREGAVVEFLAVGDWVQIHKPGQFYGKVVQILHLENGIATVQGKHWVVEHRYSIADVRLVKRGKDAQTSTDRLDV